MKQPSNKDLRIFAAVWTVFLILVSFYPMIHGDALRIWPLPPAGLFLFFGLVLPKLLKWPYKIWLRFGEFMGNIVSKVILFLIYYLLVTPTGLIARLAGRDLLNKKIDSDAKSYWIPREKQPGPMDNQF